MKVFSELPEKTNNPSPLFEKFPVPLITPDKLRVVLVAALIIELLVSVKFPVQALLPAVNCNIPPASVSDSEATVTPLTESTPLLFTTVP